MNVNHENTMLPKSHGDATLATFLLGAAVIAVFVAIVYAPSIHGGFLFDDRLLLTQSDLMKSPDALRKIWLTTEPNDYWPISNTVLWLEGRLWAMDTTGYHIVNVLLHLVNSLLLWTVLRKMEMPGAFFAAMLFAVHPVNVESVAWIAQLKTVLSMLFMLASALMYLTAEKKGCSTAPCLYPQGTLRWHLAAMGMFAASLLCKGSTAIFPLLLLTTIAVRRKIVFQDALRLLPFFILALIAIPVNVWFQTHGGEPIRDLGLLERIQGAGMAVWFYLAKAWWPLDLLFVYPSWQIHADETSWWIPFIAVLTVTVALGCNRRNKAIRGCSFSWLFFLTALLPCLGFVDVGFMVYSPVADHYQYIPLIAVSVLMGSAIDLARQKWTGFSRTLPLGVFFALLVTLTTLSCLQSALYRDVFTLYGATLAKNPNCWFLHYELGEAYRENGKPIESLEEFQKAMKLKNSQ